jgi:RNA polymerase sigma-70 factor
MSVAHPRGEPSVALKDAFDLARAAWPHVHLPEEAFAAYVLARAAGGQLAGLSVSELYLACGCVRGDRDALSSFDRDYLGKIPAQLARAGTTPEFCAEVTQLVRDRLLSPKADSPPRIAEYGGRGSLAGWVRVVALRVAADLRHEDRSFRHRANLSAMVPQPSPQSPEEATFRARYGELFRKAFRDGLQTLSPEERIILRLHFAEGLNLDGLATALGCSRATAGRRVQTARESLREATLRRIENELDASRDDVESVLTALRSQLEISLGALLTTS